jgi:hypothetical protein
MDDFGWFLIDRMNQAAGEKNYFLSGYDENQVPGKDGWRANVFAYPGRELTFQFSYKGQWYDVRHDDLIRLPQEAKDYLMSLTWFAPKPLNAVDRLARAADPMIGTIFEGTTEGEAEATT